MTKWRTGEAKQVTPLVLVLTGLLACALAEHLGYRDLVTIAVATNAAGLALLTQSRFVAAGRSDAAAGTPNET